MSQLIDPSAAQVKQPLASSAGPLRPSSATNHTLQQQQQQQLHHRKTHLGLADQYRSPNEKREPFMPTPRKKTTTTTMTLVSATAASTATSTASATATATSWLSPPTAQLAPRLSIATSTPTSSRERDRLAKKQSPSRMRTTMATTTIAMNLDQTIASRLRSSAAVAKKKKMLGQQGLGISMGPPHASARNADSPCSPNFVTQVLPDLHDDGNHSYPNLGKNHIVGDGKDDDEDEDDELGLEDSSFVYHDADPTSPTDDTCHENVMVHIRLRPPRADDKCAWITDEVMSTIALDPSLAASRGISAPFVFDGILTGSANRPVYISVARPLVKSALDGYDAVVFAYGQTASGKTFTLSGDERGIERGIIPRAVRDIFRGIRQSSRRREYLLRASYLEIWNESIKDLLDPTTAPQVRDGGKRKGTFVHPLREEVVTSPAQVRELLARGQINRHVGATDWNERSSRSHTCFKVTIESWDRDPDDFAANLTLSPSPAPPDPSKKIRVSELCLIDLAGSEKYVSVSSDRRAEGAHINKSLLTLGKVIFSLSDNKKKEGHHIPYRDSKLTRILQNSLSGNARVAVVCTLNPTPTAVEESLSTLNFAKRVKKVSLHAKRNEIEGGGDGARLGGAEAQALIVRYRDEAMALRKKVATLQSGLSTPRLDDERVQQLQERLDLLGSLVLRGGGSSASKGETLQDLDDEEEEEEEDNDETDLMSTKPPRPVTPYLASSSNMSGMSKSSKLLDNNDPPHIVQEKLFHATRKIALLQKKLVSRPSLPPDSEKDSLIAALKQQVRELEMVCEAQAVDAPPKIREDVEREFQDRLETLQDKVHEKEEYIVELCRQMEKLKRTNTQLIQLAHQQTERMVKSLISGETIPPCTPVTSGKSTTTTVNITPMTIGEPKSVLRNFQNQSLPSRLRTPRRSVSHDAGSLKKGIQHFQKQIHDRGSTTAATLSQHHHLM